MKDVQILTEGRSIIDSLDMTPSCNYLLESRPGMGKTSLIRAICTTLNVPMHTITASSMKNSNPESILGSTKDGDMISVYVFEDFDRYLESSKEEQMASILNALDGVANTPISLRFFTANRSIRGKRMEAFLSRIRRHIILDHHRPDAYDHSINIVFPAMDQTSKAQVRDLFLGADLTMRVANHILCASMVYDQPMDYIKKTIQDSVCMQYPLKSIHASHPDQDDQ